VATANASRLLARLAALEQAAEFTPYVLPEIAKDVLDDVQRDASVQLAGAEQYQVGFDLGQFQQNINEPGPLHVLGPGVGSIGILDVERMGTLDDYEQIAHEPGLFHQGTQDARGVWRNVVYPNPELRDEVARERQAVCGDKTPQWWLLLHGATGNGAYPDTPAHDFIGPATSEPNLIAKARARISQLFRGI
jgi:hypothetical protein